MAYINPQGFTWQYHAPTSGAFGYGRPASPIRAPKAAPRPRQPGTPARPAAPKPTAPPAAVLPPDPVYQAAIGNLGAIRDNTLTGLTQQRGAYLQGAGFSEDPVTHALSVDPNNPYSQNALLTQHYQQRTAGNTNSYADRGLGYAGSLSNAQNATTDQYNRSENALRNNVINFLARNTGAQTTAGNTYDYNAGVELGNSVGRASSNPLFSAAAPTAVKPVITGQVQQSRTVTRPARPRR